MKKNIRVILLTIFLLQSVCFNSFANNDTISVTAGNLNKILGLDARYLTSLTLKGEINGDDFGTLRKMTSLLTLDLSCVNIVEGGSFVVYTSPIYVKNNEIPEDAFLRMTSLMTVSLPKSATAIGNDAFTDCINLYSFNFGSEIASIGDYAFSGCYSLTSASIGDKVKTIGRDAFMLCSSLSSVSLSNSLVSIGDEAFTGCKKVVSIIIPDNVLSIGKNAFSGCSALTSLTIGESVRTIGEMAFSGCSGISSIEFPDKVETIGQKAFSDCTGLKKIVFGSSVGLIDEYAFVDCPGITEIHCRSSLPPIADGAFLNTDMNSCKLYIPENSSSLYLGHLSSWSSFTNVIEESAISSVMNADKYNVNVLTGRGVIIVEGLGQGNEISVYSLSGRLIRRLDATDGETRITVPANSTYLVRLPLKTYKAVL